MTFFRRQEPSGIGGRVPQNCLVETKSCFCHLLVCGLFSSSFFSTAGKFFVLFLFTGGFRDMSAICPKSAKPSAIGSAGQVANFFYDSFSLRCHQLKKRPKVKKKKLIPFLPPPYEEKKV